MKPITRRGPVYTRDLVSSLSASLSLVTEIARRSIIWVHTVLSFKLLNFHPTIILTETLLIEKEGEREMIVVKNIPKSAIVDRLKRDYKSNRSFHR